MRKALFVVAVLAVAHVVFAGGLVTNTNQSAQFVRSLSRNASTQVDAIYFNPAGVTQLEDGWHIAFHNQTIMQEKTVENDFMFLNQNEFVGTVDVPFFPNLYAAYKKDKWAVSFGFGPNGGGGSADFSDGLPSFEMPFSLIPYSLSNPAATDPPTPAIPTSGYMADIAFKGSSIYYGFQLNASYEINDMIAVSLGARYISAVNTYEGTLANIQINPNFPPLGLTGSYIPASLFFAGAGMMEEAALVSDAEVDVTQTGSAITPIIGINIKPIENLNIGIKYELNTSLELTNDTPKTVTVDGIEMFPDGEVTNNDIPAIFALGVEYAFLPQLRGSFSLNSYFDKSANWDGKEELIDNNYLELAFGVEYDITDALLASAGFLRAQTGVSDEYQSDLSHSLSSNTVGLGVRYKLANVFDIDLGGLYTMYDDHSVSGTYKGVPFTETYSRTNVGVVVGLGYHF